MEDQFIDFKKTGTKNTILIINDEPDILNLIENFLKRGNFDTLECSNTKEALRILEKKYKDINMILINPWIQGIKQFMHSINSYERYRNISVVFFSFSLF